MHTGVLIVVGVFCWKLVEVSSDERLMPAMCVCILDANLCMQIVMIRRTNAPLDGLPAACLLASTIVGERMDGFE